MKQQRSVLSVPASVVTTALLIALCLPGSAYAQPLALQPVPGSPFSFPGIGVNSELVLVSPNQQFLFVANQFSNSITTLSIGAGGSLSVVAGAPFAIFPPPSSSPDLLLLAWRATLPETGFMWPGAGWSPGLLLLS